MGYTYNTQFDGESLELVRLSDGERVHMQGDEATICLAEIDACGIDAVAPAYFEGVQL